MISGALSSAVATVLVYPWEKIKIEMQTCSDKESLIEAIKRVLEK